MNEDLKYTFNTVSDWLKFAEAKNAGLLALNIACIIGIMQSEQSFVKILKTFEGVLIIMFCVSSCFCIYSILPVVNKRFRFYKKMDDAEFTNSLDSLNALFFNDIAKLSAEQFIKLFEHKHGLTLKKAERDFGNQITNNAEICVQKYNYFKIASWISFGTFIAGIVLVLINTFQ
jgi:hypothetical protein